MADGFNKGSHNVSYSMFVLSAIKNAKTINNLSRIERQFKLESDDVREAFKEKVIRLFGNNRTFLTMCWADSENRWFFSLFVREHCLKYLLAGTQQEDLMGFYFLALQTKEDSFCSLVVEEMIKRCLRGKDVFASLVELDTLFQDGEDFEEDIATEIDNDQVPFRDRMRCLARQQIYNTFKQVTSSANQE